MPHYYTVEQGKNMDWRGATKWLQKTNELCLVYVQARKFSMSPLVTFSILTNQINDTLMVSLVLFMSFTRVLCNRYDARWRTKSKNTRKWRNGAIINPLFDSLTYATTRHFAHCLYFSIPLRGLEKYYATCKIAARIIGLTIE